MDALVMSRKRAPLLPTVLRGYPHVPIQKTVITFDYLDNTHSFLLAYHYHRVFLRSQPLRDINQGIIWWGDLVVCKLGMHEGYVNLYTGYDRLVTIRVVTL
jgi:hypothetical protein